ncbi:hypothetical protein BDZ97DRAFT_1764590 [Flammula alnicola]|nr:hypothetical protein BDZ97DRAFT_1764590 [Flammula alnicola]
MRLYYSQLYDRRALDTTSPLPLFNSLTHLTYLTSTSPRIREIMTMDGGLERLVRILHEFCIHPYGLTPPNARLAKLSPSLNPHSFDKHAAYRFSLAFQCIVNIGVRGSEPIRSRVVQAGTLDVVGCILEAWLANKGFAVGPSSSATGMPRETREQRQQRRLAQLEQKQREEAAHLQRALQRQLHVEQQHHRAAVRETQRQDARLGRTTEDQDDSMDYSPAESSTSHILLLSDSFSQPSNSNSDTDVSTDNSITATPQGTGTPTGSVVIPSRDRSGTVIGRPVWDQPTTTNVTTTAPRGRRIRHRELPPESPSPSTGASRAETETEDDGDGDIDMDRTEDSERIDSDVASASASPSPERRPRTVPRHNMGRRAVGIVSDEPNAGPQTLQVGGLGLDTDAHIIINEAGGVGDGGVGVEVGVEDGIVSLEPNDDFAMGAPPGAPGAIGEGATPRTLNLNNIETGRRRNTVDAPDVTPRAAVVGLPMMTAASTNGTIRGNSQPTAPHGHQRTATIRGRPAPTENNAAGTTAGAAAAAAAAAAASLNNTLGGRSSSGNHHHRDSDSGPYRDEDVLLSLQLLAYLSKYPHVRQAFYKPRVTFHPASVNIPGARFGMGVAQGSSSTPSAREKEKQKEKEKAARRRTGSSQTPVVAPTSGAPSSARQTNVFSLVERFTFKPSSTETDLPNPPPRLPPEIQYWAGVIMRNACRKDDSRGGIRQCANNISTRVCEMQAVQEGQVLWEGVPEHGWSEGHRFWCSAKDVDEDNLGDHSTSNAANQSADTSGIQFLWKVSMATAIVLAPMRVWKDNGSHESEDMGLIMEGMAIHLLFEDIGHLLLLLPPQVFSLRPQQSSMSRDRTVVHPIPSHVRSRLSARPPPNPNLNQDPTNSSYLTFHIQQQDAAVARRRAETITGASTVSTRLVADVPPNVVPPPQLPAAPLSSDWPTNGVISNPTIQAGPSRRHRLINLPTRRSPPPEDDQDDMILG